LADNRGSVRAYERVEDRNADEHEDRASHGACRFGRPRDGHWRSWSTAPMSRCSPVALRERARRQAGGAPLRL